MIQALPDTYSIIVREQKTLVLKIFVLLTSIINQPNMHTYLVQNWQFLSLLVRSALRANDTHLT